MSFYGGKEGRSYHIVHKYSTINEMVTAFKQGGQYTIVNFGEYVIIDTENKNDPDNGKLYRRGFDYLAEESEDSPGGGAIYIGQIVGPQGASPALVGISKSDFETASTVIASTIPLNSSFMEEFNSPGYYIQDGEEKFNDKIWGGYKDIQDQHGNIRGCYISFDIPYPVFQVTLKTDPYQIVASTVTENAASTAHPYYYKWDFQIPEGKHGQDITQLKTQIYGPQGNTKLFLRPYYTEYNTSSAGSTFSPSSTADWIPFRTIQGVSSSNISESYAQRMTIFYTNTYNGMEQAEALSSTFIPTQIDNITTSTATPNYFNIVLRTNNSTVSKSIEIPSANLNIAGSVASTADLPSSAETGTIMEVASRLYLYQDGGWIEIFASLFDNLEQPEKYVQVNTIASSILASKGILFLTSNFNDYWNTSPEQEVQEEEE